MSARAWAAFAALSVLWGTPYLLIKVSIEGGVPPPFVAWSRVVLGAAALLAFAWRAGVLAQLRGRLRWLVAFAATEIAVPFLLIAIGEQHVDSSVAAIIIAAAPLFVALLALRFDAAERAGGRRLVGLVVGLAGVIALVGIDVAGRADELFGAAAIIVSAFCYAAGPMILKRHLADIDARASMGASLFVAALLLAPAAAAAPPAAMPSGAAIVAVVALGLLCSAGGLVLFQTLIAEIGPGRAIVVTYINPVVALAAGMAILDERPGWGAVVGLLLILAGSYLATDVRSSPPREECR